MRRAASIESAIACDGCWLYRDGDVLPDVGRDTRNGELEREATWARMACALSGLVC